MIPSASAAATIAPTSSFRRQRLASAACRTSPKPTSRQEGSICTESKVLDIQLSLLWDHSVLLPGAPPLLSLKCACWPHETKSPKELLRSDSRILVRLSDGKHRLTTN